MRQPWHSLLRHDLRQIEHAVLSLEMAMTGFHFSDAAAEEVRALARRLENLADPRKGYLKDGATALPIKDAA